jgi:predicted transcriptional regulator
MLLRMSWTFLTNHGQVMLCIARDPAARIRDIAEQVQITERSAQKIVGDLVQEGYVERKKVGRRNEYVVHPDVPMRHEMTRDHDVGEILGLLTPTKAA